MRRLDGRIALVTGGSRGIGRATAVALGEAGASVAVVYRERVVDAERVVGEIEAGGGTAVALACDVRRRDEVNGAVAATRERLGGLDILVNAAGAAMWRDSLEVSEEEYDLQFDVNAKAIFLTSQAAAPALREAGRGRIINITSISAQIGDPQLVAYGASKAAADMLTRGFAAALGPHGITVNSVAPGTVPTDLNAHRLDEALRAEIIGDTPLRRLGTPQDIASVVVFLASDDAAFITGTTLVIDGGFLL